MGRFSQRGMGRFGASAPCQLQGCRMSKHPTGSRFQLTIISGYFRSLLGIWLNLKVIPTCERKPEKVQKL